MGRLRIGCASIWLAWVLTGCSGNGGFVAPLVGDLDNELAAGRFELINFDETSLTGSPFSRDGTTRQEAAIAAVDLGVKGANAFGRNLDSFSEGSAGIRSFDSFVLVPVRSRVPYEVVDEMIGDRHVTGTIRVEDGRRLARLVSAGEGAELLLQQDENPPHLITQVTGYDTIAPFGKLTFRLLNEEVIDPVADRRTGRLRAEVYRPDGTLLYAADANHDGTYDESSFALRGIDIWFAADGFWVRGLSDLEHVDAASAVGTVEWKASDGQRVALNFERSGQLNGTVEQDDELVAELFVDDRGRLVLVEAGAAGISGPEPLATFDLQTLPPLG